MGLPPTFTSCHSIIENDHKHQKPTWLPNLVPPLCVFIFSDRNYYVNKGVSEWLLLSAKWAILQLYHGVNKLHDDVRFVLDQHAELDFYSASSLKQQSAGRHIGPPGHIIILIPSQPFFALSPWCCVLSGEATNINFIVNGLTRPGLEPTVYHTRGEHTDHYTTHVVYM